MLIPALCHAWQDGARARRGTTSRTWTSSPPGVRSWHPTNSGHWFCSTRRSTAELLSAWLHRFCKRLTGMWDCGGRLLPSRRVLCTFRWLAPWRAHSRHLVACGKYVISSWCQCQQIFLGASASTTVPLPVTVPAPTATPWDLFGSRAKCTRSFSFDASRQR